MNRFKWDSNGVASEAMLKMKEMSLSYSEAFHFLEFRHGPMSMVNDHTLVVGLIGEEAAAQEIAVLRNMKARGAQILALTENDHAMNEWAHVVHLDSMLPSWARPVTYMPVLQLMAYYRALSNGQNGAGLVSNVRVIWPGSPRRTRGICPCSRGGHSRRKGRGSEKKPSVSSNSLRL